MKSTTFEVIVQATPSILQALTPIVLAGFGCWIGIQALSAPPDKMTAGLGLAGTAIAGAAGLAKNESFSVEKKGESVRVTSPSTQPSIEE